MILFPDTNTREKKYLFFGHFQIKILRTLKWGECLLLFVALNFALLLCSHRWSRTDLSVDSHVLLSGNIELFWETGCLYISVLKLVHKKHDKSVIMPYCIQLVIILSSNYYRFMATMYFIYFSFSEFLKEECGT